MTWGRILAVTAGVIAAVLALTPPGTASAGTPYTVTPTTGGTATPFVVDVPICAGGPGGYDRFYVVNPDDDGELFTVPLDDDGRATFTVSVIGDSEASATEVAAVDPHPYVTGFDCLSAPGVRHLGGWPDSPGTLALTFEAAAPVGTASTSTSTPTPSPPETVPPTPSSSGGDHERAGIASSLRPVDAGGVGPEAIGLALAVATLLALLLVFPSALFNSTLEQHHDEIVGWLPWRRGRGDGADEAGSSQGRTLARFAGVTAAAALLYGLLDPQLGADRASFAQVLGIGTSLVVVSLLGGVLTARVLRRHGHSAEARFEVFPWVLAIGAGCVAVSRALEFQPGYLYGLIGGLTVSAELSKRDDGRARAVSAVALLGVSLAAWFAWSAVAGAADHGDPGFLTIILDGLLGAVVVTGVEGLVFGLLPLRFLPGDAVVAWSRRGWIALFGSGLFLYAYLLVRPAAGDNGAPGPPIGATIGLFVGFSLVSLSFWGYFRFRPPRPAGRSGTVIDGSDVAIDAAR